MPNNKNAFSSLPIRLFFTTLLLAASIVVLAAVNSLQGFGLLSPGVAAAQTASSPFGGTPAAIAGRIEAEKFDEGGEGVAYHDLTPENSFGSTYRTGGVDVKDLSTASNGRVVSTTKPGEWLVFTVNVAQAGTYSVVMNAAGQGSGGTVNLTLDGSALSGSTMTVPNTGSFSTFANSNTVSVALPAGQHKLRLNMVTAGASTQGDTGAIDYLTFTLTGSATPAPTSPPSGCATTTAPATTYGQVKQSVSVTTAGTYRVWSRVKTTTSANNSYWFQVDSGCAVNVGDSTAIPVNTWTWVNYQQNNQASFVDVTLTAGTHQLTYTGREADVQLDRVLLLSDLSCVPTGTGDNCANVDATNPTVSITAPTSGTSVTAGATVNITATASDSVGVTKVEFYVDGALKSTDTSSPYAYAWPTTGVTAGTHSLTARAYDAANNTATSAPVSVTVNAAPISDTTAPTATVTVSPTTVTLGAASTISATANDNVGVTKVEFYASGTLVGTDTSSPYSMTWTPTTVGAKSMTAKAYDAAGNVGTSGAATLTVNSTPTTINGDANGDGRVNSLDFSILSEHDGENFPAADFNKDGTVGAADLAVLLANWTW